MTKIERKACAFLLSFLMCISVIMPSFAETVNAEEVMDEIAQEELLQVESMDVSDGNEQDIMEDIPGIDVQPETDDVKPEDVQGEIEDEIPEISEGLEDEISEISEEEDEILIISEENEDEFPVILGETEDELLVTPGEPEGISSETVEKTEMMLLDGDTENAAKRQNEVWAYQVIDEENREIAITGYLGSDTEVIIPSAVTVTADQSDGSEENTGEDAEKTGEETDITYTVVQIGERAFEENTKLTAVTIPRTVTVLQYAAFIGCNGLKKVSFEKGSVLETINCDVFRNDTALESFECPENLKIIGESVFEGDSALAAVNLNDKLGNIGKMAFRNTGIQSIRIPDGISVIADGTFENCQELSKVILGSGVREIGYAAFSSCKKLTDIALPIGLTSIGLGAFWWSGLTAIDIPDSVTSIGSYAFSECSDLKKIKIGNGLAYIGSRAFWNTGVKNLTIGNKVKAIGREAFAGNKSLTSVVIPSNVTQLQYGTFADCSNLVSITLPDSIEHIVGLEFHGTAWYDSQPEGAVYLGKAFYNYKGNMKTNSALTIKPGTRCIAGYSCMDQKNLTSVILPEGLISIGEVAFYETGLKSIYIPPSVTRIDTGAVGYKRGGNKNLGLGSFISNGQVDTDFIIYGYLGTAAETYAKSNGIKFVSFNQDIGRCTISGIASSYSYTGAEIRPEITVMNNGTEVLPENYTVSYKNNIQKGIATVTITGKGSMTGSVTKTFTILPLAIKECTVNGLSKAFDYTGKAIKPAITIKKGSLTVPSSNYTVSFKNNKAIGTATAIIKGKGNFTGSVTKTFVIQPKITVKTLRYSKVMGAKAFKLNAKSNGKAALKYSSNNKKVVTVNSKGSVTIKGSGEAVITISTTVNKIKAIKKINITVKPGKVTSLSLKVKKRAMTASWKKASGCIGYELQYSTSKKFTAKTTKSITMNKITQVKKTISKMKPQTYYVRVRARGRNDLKGAWSKTASVKVK